ncbi:MFS general substrate transporter [Amylocystis lapponica]|nr:MFS general substrate transporter [Amylocystis lapponica]
MGGWMPYLGELRRLRTHSRLVGPLAEHVTAPRIAKDCCMTTHQEDTTHQVRRRQHTEDASLPATSDMAPRGLTTSLESIQILPRTPRTPRTGQHAWTVRDGRPIDEVELSLLDEDERRSMDGLLTVEEEQDYLDQPVGKHPMSSRDKKAMVLLIILYLIQGFPLGLALGSIPFILREHLSYSQLAIFSLSSYPYSLKLLWSPIVDSWFFPTFGRRKSWIIPMQLVVGTIMLALSFRATEMMSDPANHIYSLTAAFTGLVLFSATQDIAVDGWALTLLSEENLPYASTCQTIGLNTGYLLSYTVFLALNSQAFSDKWGIPRLTLSTYLLFCSLASFLVTIWLLFTKEDTETVEEDISIKAVYTTMWTICKLRHVQILLVVHLCAKIGFAANDAATHLKMVEKGLGREDLAATVLIDFPFQIFGGWLAGRLSRGEQPLRPWIYAYWPRILLALSATLIVYWFPKPPITTGFFVLLVVQTVALSFSGTIQFGGMSAFHTRISDPVVGGTYMTLLNTFSNMGGTWPKFFVLKGVDLFSIATCNIGEDVSVKAAECVSDNGKKACAALGGECVTERDGYYIVSGICMGLGLLLVLFYMLPTARKLQAVPVSKWRVY